MAARLILRGHKRTDVPSGIHLTALSHEPKISLQQVSQTTEAGHAPKFELRFECLNVHSFAQLLYSKRGTLDYIITVLYRSFMTVFQGPVDIV